MTKYNVTIPRSVVLILLSNIYWMELNDDPGCAQGYLMVGYSESMCASWSNAIFLPHFSCAGYCESVTPVDISPYRRLLHHGGLCKVTHVVLVVLGVILDCCAKDTLTLQGT